MCNNDTDKIIIINKISTLEAQKDIENMFDNYDWIGNTKKTNKQCNG